MDTRTFAGLLAATPPANLGIIELTAELTRPDGSLDLDAAAARQKDVEMACAQVQNYASATGRLKGGDAVAVAAPALLSGLAEVLLRRPPSLRELVTIVGYDDDYAWFVGLVAASFPTRRRRRSRPPTCAPGWSASPTSSERSTFPSTCR